MTEKLLPFPPARLDPVRLDTGERVELATLSDARHLEELGRRVLDEASTPVPSSRQVRAAPPP